MRKLRAKEKKWAVEPRSPGGTSLVNSGSHPTVSWTGPGPASSKKPSQCPAQACAGPTFGMASTRPRLSSEPWPREGAEPPKHRGASPWQRPGPPQGGAARASADPGSAASAAAAAAASKPAVSAPPPWNSDPARRGRAGPHALKGAAWFPDRQRDMGEELESPDEPQAEN
ncbi:PREDICTED: homeobox protein cut-like 1-like [Chrysochloris asiatica]|uniref:Homeobox protein cut-like 1-like n=1 Tax=Chrysochloris asiatica TaxID=185453 RepID=A0A9B0TYL0_CHRAS|nr:PREDICTED: homeobox protein cut-like 1-like [Chrysochloris asiatica]